jgi:hypothetical protein
MRLEPRSYFWICWKVSLAHSQERAALTHARADMDVYRM